MAKRTTSKLGSGRVNTNALLVLILVLVVGAAGWLIYDNHRTPPPPAAFKDANGKTTAPPLPLEFQAPAN